MFELQPYFIIFLINSQLCVWLLSLLHNLFNSPSFLRDLKCHESDLFQIITIFSYYCSVLNSMSSFAQLCPILRPHESQHARPPCPSPTPGFHSNSCPSSRWCRPAISSSVIPFSSCPQSLPASESFPMSQLFSWGGQSRGVSALASVLPKNTQDWSPIGWTGWISLQSKGLSRVFSNITVQITWSTTLSNSITILPFGKSCWIHLIIFLLFEPEINCQILWIPFYILIQCININYYGNILCI